MKAFDPDESIYGQRIAVRTRNCRIIKGLLKSPTGKPQKIFKFATYAYCVIEKAVEQKPATLPDKCYIGKDDSIEGEIVSGQANDNDRIDIVGGATSTHKAQFLRLYGEAFCVIDIPIKSKRK